MTNGCFDILHTGHIHILNEAKKLGDILIVALNSDSSIKLNKGEKDQSTMKWIEHLFYQLFNL